MGAQDDDQRQEFVEGFKFNGIVMEQEEADREGSTTSSGSIGSSSSFSIDSSDMGDDASSSPSSSTSSMSKYSASDSSSPGSPSNGRGPLYELSELMSHLPMKRGLSKYYDGRSQSYTSLASVKSVEDLQKKEIMMISTSCNGRKRMKLCSSYGGGLDHNRSSSAMSPKPLISKKGSMGRRSSLGFANRSPVHVLKT